MVQLLSNLRKKEVAEVSLTPDLNELFGLDTSERVELKEYAHIISPPENPVIYGWLVRQGNPDPSVQDILAFAIQYKCFVTALCGYEWIPRGTGEGLDACQICFDVAGMHMRNAGE